MPQSRKRPGHHHHKPSATSVRQRTKGRIVWALLLAVFGLIIAVSAAGANYVSLPVGALAGAAVGYFIGRRMEREAAEK